MLTVRWVWGLGAFVVLGVLTGLVVNRCTLATVVCLLLVPPIAFLAPFALGQGARNLSTLRKRLNWWHAAWFLIVLSGLVFRVRDTPDHQRGSHRRLGSLPNEPCRHYGVCLVIETCPPPNAMDRLPLSGARRGIGGVFLSLCGFNPLVCVPRVDAI